MSVTPPPDPYTALAPPEGSAAPAGPGWATPSGSQWAPPSGTGSPPAPAPVRSAPVLPAPAAPGTDGISAAALVTGILSLGVVPLVLGIVGLVRVSRTRQRGTGFAIAGIVLGVVSAIGWTAVGTFLAFSVLSDDGRAEAPVAAAEEVGDPEGDWVYLDIGMCIDWPDGDDGLSANVDCAVPHDAEVYAAQSAVNLNGSGYPGEDAVFDQADDFCQGTAFLAYVGAEYEDSSLEVYYYYPDAAAWKVYDRGITCVVAFADGTPLPGGSVRDTGM